MYARLAVLPPTPCAVPTSASSVSRGPLTWRERTDDVDQPIGGKRRPNNDTDPARGVVALTTFNGYQVWRPRAYEPLALLASNQTTSGVGLP